MAEPNYDEKLSGEVEVDEVYIGGRPRNKGKNKRGRGTKKTPVLGLVQRNGNIRLRVVPNVTSKTLREAIWQDVELSSRIITDELPAYKGIGKAFTGGHGVVHHGHREYVRGTDTTNTIESLFALIKRGVYGTFHAVSKKHLHRYLSEFEFRWMTRKVDDGERLKMAIKNADGKRLRYYEPTRKSQSA